MFQSEKVELEGECRAKDEQLAVREAEVEHIPILRTELEKLRVRISEMTFVDILPPSLRSPPPLLLHYSTLITDREEWYGGGMSREG